MGSPRYERVHLDGSAVEPRRPPCQRAAAVIGWRLRPASAAPTPTRRTAARRLSGRADDILPLTFHWRNDHMRRCSRHSSSSSFSRVRPSIAAPRVEKRAPQHLPICSAELSPISAKTHQKAGETAEEVDVAIMVASPFGNQRSDHHTSAMAPPGTDRRFAAPSEPGQLTEGHQRMSMSTRSGRSEAAFATLSAPSRGLDHAVSGSGEEIAQDGAQVLLVLNDKNAFLSFCTGGDGGAHGQLHAEGRALT